MKRSKYRVMYIVLLIVVVVVSGVILFLNHPRFGRTPKGERLERVKQSPNYRNGEFHNKSLTPQLTSDKGRLATMLSAFSGRSKRVRPDRAIPVVKTDLKSFDRVSDIVVWFGHSSYFIQVNGKRVLVDPVFKMASPVSFINTAFDGTEIYTPDDMPEIDYLVITHDHWDHLDYYTVKELKNKVAKVVCPLGVGEHFERWGFDKNNLVELDWYQQSVLDNDFEVYCLPARHFSGRGLVPKQTLWASFMLETPSKTIYIGGDGGYDTHFADIAKRFPHIDIAFLENGQYNKDWRFIHLLPDDVVKAAKDLNPQMLFAFHNSKYALSKHDWDEPLNLIAKAAETDSINLITPMIGEPVFTDEVDKKTQKWWTN